MLYDGEFCSIDLRGERFLFEAMSDHESRTHSMFDTNFGTLSADSAFRPDCGLILAAQLASAGDFKCIYLEGCL